MFNIIIDWYEGYCKVNPESFIFEDLYITKWEGCSKETVELSIREQISNLAYNHYGNLGEQIEIKHNFLI